MSPSQWLLLFSPSLASGRQGEEGLVLVVSRGRCHVAERMHSRSPDLWRYTVKRVGRCDLASFIDRPSAGEARFSLGSWIIKAWWDFWPQKEGSGEQL